jgi:inner membrane protein
VDPLSHAALGAAWSEVPALRKKILAGAVLGAASAMAPDVDLLIRSRQDPLLALEFHRHFTHSLAFVPVGALVCMALLFPFWRRRMTLARSYGFCLLGYATHGLLDACTSYGTLLLWPFSRARIAWDLVSVVDPLLTLPLIACVLLAGASRRPWLAAVGAAWCVAYLGLGLVQNHRATAAAAALAASRGHAPAVIEVKPSFGNIVLWKSIYEHDGRFYIDAVRVGVRPLTFAGESRRKLEVERDFPWLRASMQQWQDVERFERFADGYLAIDRKDPNRIVDLRYSLVPNRPDAFWGIELDAAAGPDAHATYVTMRIRSPAEGRALVNMIFRGDEGE